MTGGKALIFSAPSGSGKTTIVKHLLNTNNRLAFSISACTRQIRANEVDGRDYYFLSKEEFENKINSDEFVEWEEVYGGSYYGTLKSEVSRIWGEGKAVVFDVDVKGGVRLKQYFDDQALAVFIKVPSMNELASRLTDRGTESTETLKARIEKAQYELGFEDKFDVTLVNDELDESFKQATDIVNGFLDQ